jgi:hypothetical protein
LLGRQSTAWAILPALVGIFDLNGVPINNKHVF